MALCVVVLSEGDLGNERIRMGGEEHKKLEKPGR